MRAENGIGASPTESKLELIVYPLHPTVDITMEKSIFVPGKDIRFPCKIRGYPPPTVRWYKISYWRGRSKEALIEDDERRVIHTVSEGNVKFVSNLVIHNVTSDDSGSYKCEARSAFTRPVSDLEGISIQYGPGQLCIDRPSYKHCDKVVEHKFCGNVYYGQFCCISCTRAGLMPGGAGGA